MDSVTQYEHASSTVFDYVIIGGGTAGLTVAARLTEDPAVQVVVLEAGERRVDDPHINIPGLVSTLYGDDKYDWSFHTTPQSSLNNRIIGWPRGKVLGGSSAINLLMASHASRVDIDNWEKLGNTGWNFDALQPYYRKAETYNIPSEATAKALGTHIVNPALYGNSGPVQITFTESPGQLDQAWAPTFTNLGIGPKTDPRDGNTLGGYSLPKYMDRSSKRSHAGSAFYEPNSGRKNLTVLTNALVKKIEFDTKGDKVTATGVRYVAAGQDYFVRTKGEVILAAGSVQSPQILELSGIGSRIRLQKLQIKTVVDNPNVGENLQDHPLLSFSYGVLDGIPTAEMIKQPGVLDWALQEWTQTGAGPLSTGITGTAFLSLSSVLAPDQKIAVLSRIRQILSEVPVSSAPGLQKQLELQKEVLLDDNEADLQYNMGASGFNPSAGDDLRNWFNHDDAGGYVGFVSVLTHAFSRGSIHIRSADPNVYPVIDPRYMEHPVDIEILASALLFTQTISETEPISNLLKSNVDGNGKMVQPAFKVSGRLTKERAVQMVKEASSTSFHPMGTCSMLPREDGGVVDTRLKVYGVANLRVVDASVMPLSVRGNIASSVYAIAEKASDLIKEDRLA